MNFFSKKSNLDLTNPKLDIESKSISESDADRRTFLKSLAVSAGLASVGIPLSLHYEAQQKRISLHYEAQQKRNLDNFKQMLRENPIEGKIAYASPYSVYVVNGSDVPDNIPVVPICIFKNKIQCLKWYDSSKLIVFEHSENSSKKDEPSIHLLDVKTGSLELILDFNEDKNLSKMRLDKFLLESDHKKRESISPYVDLAYERSQKNRGLIVHLASEIPPVRICDPQNITDGITLTRRSYCPPVFYSTESQKDLETLDKTEN